MHCEKSEELTPIEGAVGPEGKVETKPGERSKDRGALRRVDEGGHNKRRAKGHRHSEILAYKNHPKKGETVRNRAIREKERRATAAVAGGASGLTGGLGDAIGKTTQLQGKRKKNEYFCERATRARKKKSERTKKNKISLEGKTSSLKPPILKKRV